MNFVLFELLHACRFLERVVLNRSPTSIYLLPTSTNLPTTTIHFFVHLPTFNERNQAQYVLNETAFVKKKKIKRHFAESVQNG